MRIGRTSIAVNFEIFVQHLSTQHNVVKMTEATLTYVATDAQAKPRPVPRPG